MADPFKRKLRRINQKIYSVQREIQDAKSSKNRIVRLQISTLEQKLKAFENARTKLIERGW